ncbi:hypothetical protein ACWEOE_08960 [Amycolatopsis sp. NPDC004368]
MRIRFAVGVGALLLAGGALTGGAVAFARPAPPSSQPTRVTPPAQAPSSAPTERPGTPPTAVPTRVAPPVKAPGAVRVPTAIPAGPTGDLNLPAIWG